MKKSFLTTAILIAVFSFTSVFAQNYGVKASFNMYNVNAKVNDKKVENLKITPVFDAGVFAEINVADEFFVRPELLFKQKGFKVKESTTILNTTTEVKGNTTLNYIELPVYFLYKGALSGGNILVGVGPYFSYGLFGKSKVETVTSGSLVPGDNITTNETTDIKFKGDVKKDDDKKYEYVAPFDFGGNVMAGYELSNGLQVAITASMGMINTLPKYEGTKPEKSSTKNLGFGLSLGYRF